MQEITVKTLSTQSKIYIGTDACAMRLPHLCDGQKNFVVTDAGVFALYSRFFDTYFPNTEIFILPVGESAKTFPYLQSILERMLAVGLHRSSKLFAVGGGVVGDIAGLCASLYMRGIPYVQIPTTLLAQVDSSVGGKTAVDLRGVKNAIGAFYQPQEVLVNPEFLHTLSDKEIKCGLGEIVKYGALDGKIFDLLNDTETLNAPDFLANLVMDCIAHKAKVVEADEREAGVRKSLNLGHTTAHAMELDGGCSHGECVLYGMLFETQIAMELGVCEKSYGQKLCALAQRALVYAPTKQPDFTKIADLVIRAKLDKKNADDGAVTLVVAKAKGEWAGLSLPYAEYANRLAQAIKRCGYDTHQA